MFIVFEGIEGCGKTTQIRLLGEFLESRQLACTMTREPGGTPVGEEVRKIFLHSDNRALTPLTELLLVTAARAQHVHQVIQPALAAGRVVVCDRFFDATFAYQGYAGSLPLDMVRQSHELFLSGITPDVTLLLDCPVAEGLQRSRSRNRAEGKEVAEGRFEDMDLEFHEQVRQGYLERARQEPERFALIDALQDVASVQDRICQVVSERLREKGYAV
ncbi:dTMP kinase [Thermodesulfobacteriota bacterium]